MIDINTLNFVPVYTGRKANRGKETTIKGMLKKPGVYLIKEDGVLVYIGMSKRCCKHQMLRHFHVWNDRRHLYVRDSVDRVTYNDGRMERYVYTVALLVAENGEQAHELEKELIKHYNPRDNKQKYVHYLDEQELKTLIQDIQKLNVNGYETESIF